MFAFVLVFDSKTRWDVALRREAYVYKYSWGPSRKYKQSAAPRPAWQLYKKRALRRSCEGHKLELSAGDVCICNVTKADEDFCDGFEEGRSQEWLSLMVQPLTFFAASELSPTGFCWWRPVITSIGQSIIQSLWQGGVWSGLFISWLLRFDRHLPH